MGAKSNQSKEVSATTYEQLLEFGKNSEEETKDIVDQHYRINYINEKNIEESEEEKQ